MKKPPARSILLDAQALSLLLDNDRRMIVRIEAARREGVPVLVSVLTIVEAVYGKTDTARLNWVLSRLKVEEVSQAASAEAIVFAGNAMVATTLGEPYQAEGSKRREALLSNSAGSGDVWFGGERFVHASALLASSPDPIVKLRSTAGTGYTYNVSGASITSGSQ